MICNKCNHNLPDDSEFCQYCGNKIEVVEQPVIDGLPNVDEMVLTGPKAISTPTKKVKTTQSNKNQCLPSDKLVSFTNISAIVLTIVSMLTMFIALNIQDAKRNIYEDWNPTAVYIILLLISSGFLAIAATSWIKKDFKLIAWASTIPLIAGTIAIAEESIMETWNYSYDKHYLNAHEVEVCNAIWFMIMWAILFIVLIPVVVYAIKKMQHSWHQSISYREKCYKRVAKMHDYLDKGIITQEEFEKTRIDILKYIE